MQGLLGDTVCQQLGSEAIDSAVSQTAGLLPRDLHALVADAAAAAAARKLDVRQMLPSCRAEQPAGLLQLTHAPADADGQAEARNHSGSVTGKEIVTTTLHKGQQAVGHLSETASLSLFLGFCLVVKSLPTCC